MPDLALALAATSHDVPLCRCITHPFDLCGLILHCVFAHHCSVPHFVLALATTGRDLCGRHSPVPHFVLALARLLDIFSSANLFLHSEQRYSPWPHLRLLTLQLARPPPGCPPPARPHPPAPPRAARRTARPGRISDQARGPCSIREFKIFVLLCRLIHGSGTCRVVQRWLVVVSGSPRAAAGSRRRCRTPTKRVRRRRLGLVWPYMCRAQRFSPRCLGQVRLVSPRCLHRWRLRRHRLGRRRRVQTIWIVIILFFSCKLEPSCFIVTCLSDGFLADCKTRLFSCPSQHLPVKFIVHIARRDSHHIWN